MRWETQGIERRQREKSMQKSKQLTVHLQESILDHVH